jgi:putative ABC transport system permease protein
MLSSFFGLVAGLLAIVGLYGLVAYLVARKRQEIGLRMALGASRSNVIVLVVKEGLLLLAMGLGIGSALAYAAAREAGTLLYGLGPDDPMTFAVAGSVLLLSTLAACCLPAVRAARVDPTIALRAE